MDVTPDQETRTVPERLREIGKAPTHKVPEFSGGPLTADCQCKGCQAIRACRALAAQIETPTEAMKRGAVEHMRPGAIVAFTPSALRIADSVLRAALAALTLEDTP